MSKRKPIDVLAMFPELADIRDAVLRQAVVDVWQELWSLSNYDDMATVPISPEISYPTLPHNQCVLRMAIACAVVVVLVLVNMPWPGRPFGRPLMPGM